MTPVDDPKTPNQGVEEPDGERRGGHTADATEQNVERLTKELAEKTAEATRNWDLYLRERADVENFKKRMQREKSEALRFAIEPLAKDLLPVIDDLERAVEHATGGGNGQPLVEGVRLVLKNALDVLERHGVTRVDAAGRTFDPSRHEAVVQVRDAARPPNQVVEQFVPGYTLHDRLLRPAQVSVSAKPPVEDQQNDD
jgi:molecular chaperone GrpE